MKTYRKFHIQQVQQKLYFEQDASLSQQMQLPILLCLGKFWSEYWSKPETRLPFAAQSQPVHLVNFLLRKKHTDQPAHLGVDSLTCSFKHTTSSLSQNLSPCAEGMIPTHICSKALSPPGDSCTTAATTRPFQSCCSFKLTLRKQG